LWNRQVHEGIRSYSQGESVGQCLRVPLVTW
jgi:hypothetical protein